MPARSSNNDRPAQVLASPCSVRLKLFLRRYQGDYLAV
jgi:hypothetical protein